MKRRVFWCSGNCPNFSVEPEKEAILYGSRIKISNINAQTTLLMKSNRKKGFKFRKT